MSALPSGWWVDLMNLSPEMKPLLLVFLISRVSKSSQLTASAQISTRRRRSSKYLWAHAHCMLVNAGTQQIRGTWKGGGFGPFPAHWWDRILIYSLMSNSNELVLIQWPDAEEQIVSACWNELVQTNNLGFKKIKACQGDLSATNWLIHSMQGNQILLGSFVLQSMSPKSASNVRHSRFFGWKLFQSSLVNRTYRMGNRE